ncbi:MAG: BMC domain-containing protein [Bdellovibrionales bacterium]|jgi:ethanolamine utilization microcompartment shell protein EutS|nr:BMC domain-containing protein [Bdellovibrionales bacterium]MBT3527216.1 BMC domain-containing protein [Bdellovibrionales bacterium]MBT7670500.1 BMC domain-containing protein [Bdellovibrionales bacterium]
MTTSNFELRTLTFIDSLQPQLAQFIAKDNRVYDPSEYDSSLFIEIAPAMEIHSMIDMALKATNARLSSVVTERHFGLMQVHHPDQGEVMEAGNAVLRETGLNENDRAEVKILTNKIIRGVEQDHAIMFTGTTKGNMVVAGESVFIMEATPAAYLTIACNEALKAANIKLVDIKPFGATGRLIMTGPESEIDSAAEAAINSLDKLNEMQKSKVGTQLG